MRVVLVLLACVVAALSQAPQCLPDSGSGNFSASFSSASGSLCIKPCPSDTCVPTPGNTIGIYYTVFLGQPNIWKADLIINDTANTITTNNDRSIASTNGADGILGSPIGNKLYIGGQDTHINVYDLATQTVATANAPYAVFHMTVVRTGFSTPVLFGTDIYTHRVSKFVISSTDGSLSDGTSVTVTGNTLGISTLIKGPRNSFYYVADSTNDKGNKGEFGIATPSADGNTVLVTPLPAYTNVLNGCYHGGYYDPYSESILLWGADNVCQYILATAEMIVTTRTGRIYDQGTPDGLGHIFLANNRGSLDWISYRTSKRIDQPDATGVLLTRNRLDDVAPLIGGGSAC